MKIYLTIASAALLLTSCNQAELAETRAAKDSLTAVIIERDETIDEFIITFNDVERNLDSVAMRQQLIRKNTDQPGELQANQKSRINSEIAAINDLMDQNRKKIAELTRKLKNSSKKNASLEKVIATLNNQVAEKDNELMALNERLNSLNAQVAQLETSVTTLTAENTSQSQIIAEETMALHTAYYVVGKKKELEEANLIDLKGGLLGMGKTTKLQGDVDNNKFTRIDYTQATNIPINGVDAKIITSHPSDSYQIDKDAADKDKTQSIVITNPEKFWSVSKYLVVVKD